MGYVEINKLSVETSISRFRLNRLIEEGRLIAVTAEGKIFVDEDLFASYLRSCAPMQASSKARSEASH